MAEFGGDDNADRNVEMWKIKKLIKSLEAARGYRTRSLRWQYKERYSWSLCVCARVYQEDMEGIDVDRMRIYFFFPLIFRDYVVSCLPSPP